MSKQPLNYYSALKRAKIDLSGVEDASWGEVFELPNGIAFRHDICLGLATQHHSCSAFFAELAFPAGMSYFNQEAGVATKYPDYIRIIGRLMESTSKPAIVVAGKAAAKVFPSADVFRISLRHGTTEQSYGYNLPRSYDGFRAEDVVKDFCRRGFVVGDFCCGLGNTGRAVADAGGRFVLSDVNGRCIREIAERILK